MESEMIDATDITINGGQLWHKKDGPTGFWHREDGPARIYKNGKEYWHYYNKAYSLEDMPLNLFLSYCKWEYKKNGS